MTLAIDNKSTICTKDFASVIWNCIDSLLSWHLTLVLPSLACLVYKHLIPNYLVSNDVMIQSILTVMNEGGSAGSVNVTQV